MKFIYIDYNSLKQLAKKLSDKIEKKYDKIIIITKWWLHLGYYIADNLKIRNIQTINIETRSEWQTQPKIYWNIPVVEKGERVLIVDDLIDSWKTFNIIKSLYKDIDFATLFVKKKFIEENPLITDQMNIYYIDHQWEYERLTFYYER